MLDVFIVEFVDVVKLVEAELFHLYTYLYFCFEGLGFDAFNSFINHIDQQLPLDYYSNSTHL